MTIAPLSLETEEHFQPLDKPSRYAPRRGRDEYTEDGIKTESETTPSGEEMSSFERRYAQRDEEEEETDTETEARRRAKREREPRIKVEDFDDDEIFGGADQGEEDKEMRLRSLESLQAKDAADLAEAIRQSRMRDLLEARRMSGAGPSGSASTALLHGEGLIDVMDPTAPISPDELSEIQLSRRVLDRLDEETEEDTDVGSSRPSSRLAATFAPAGSGGAAGGPGGETDPWEDLEGDSGSSESAAEASGVRQRRQHKDDEEDLHESTIGGVSIHFQFQRISCERARLTSSLVLSTASCNFNSRRRQAQGQCAPLEPPQPLLGLKRHKPAEICTSTLTSLIGDAMERKSIRAAVVYVCRVWGSEQASKERQFTMPSARPASWRSSGAFVRPRRRSLRATRSQYRARR